MHLKQEAASCGKRIRTRSRPLQFVENTKPSFAVRRKHEAAFCSCGSKTAIYFLDLHHAFETGSRLMWEAYTNTKPSFAVRIENTKPSFAFRRKHEAAFCSCGSKTAIYFVDLHHAFETGSRLMWKRIRTRSRPLQFVENTKPSSEAVALKQQSIFSIYSKHFE